MKRIISVLTALSLILCLAACGKKENTAKKAADTSSKDSSAVQTNVDISGNKKDSAVVAREYTGLYGENSFLLNSNPDKGFRGIFEFYHYDYTDEELAKKLADFPSRITKYTPATVFVCYFYLTDYRNKDLDDKLFNVMQKSFDYFREQKYTVLLRFAYTTHQDDVSPTTERILSHMDQLKDIVAKNTDVLHVFQAGFVGKFGEWHSERVNICDREKVLNYFMTNLLPDGVYTQVRTPAYKNFVSDDKEYKKLIGFHKDDYFGIMNTDQMGDKSEYIYGHSGWEQQLKEGAYTPNDAELYWWSQFEDMREWPEAYASLVGASQLRLTTLSAYNGYLDQGPMKDGAMVRWKSYPVTEKWCKENGINYSENWFKNIGGAELSRSVFDFIRDYVGYRIQAKELKCTGGDKCGDKIDIELKINNLGFSSAFNLESGFAILDSNGNEVSSVQAGDPEKWYGTDPDDYSKRELLEHKINATLKLPEKYGTYRLAFYMRNKLGVGARLDNNVEFENGYNIIHEFKL